MQHIHTEEHKQLLRQNGKYGHLGAKYGKFGGRPRKKRASDPPENPLKNAHLNPLENALQLLFSGKQTLTPELIEQFAMAALLKRALGYQAPKNHVRPQIDAILQLLHKNKLSATITKEAKNGSSS